MGQKLRADKIISNLGYGTRKEVKELIKDGGVEVDNVIISDPGQLIDPHVSNIKVNGKLIRFREFIYLMLNKPQDVISATEDKREKTVIDLLSDEFKVFEPAPVGRLDKDTEGLLLLTNDGQLAHKLISPKNHVPKKYYAHIKGIVEESDIKAFRAGIIIDGGYKTMPGHLTLLKQGDISEVEVIIYEGKYHQIKRMFKARGKEVIYLKRMSMGDLLLDAQLELGEYRELTEDELKLLLQH